MAKAFASQADLADKKTTFARLGDGLCCLAPRAIPTPA